MMTIEELYQKYNADMKRATNEYQAWREQQIAWARGAKVNAPNLPYSGFKLDYDFFTKELGNTIKSDFNLSDIQTAYIMNETYDRYHSGFCEMFDGAREIASFVTKFPKD